MREQELQSQKQQDVIDEHPTTREFRKNQKFYVKMDDNNHWQKSRVIKRYGKNSKNHAIQHENRIVKKDTDAIKSRYTSLISMKENMIPDPQKVLLTRDLAHSNLKLQRLQETIERIRKANARNLRG